MVPGGCRCILVDACDIEDACCNRPSLEFGGGTVFAVRIVDEEACRVVVVDVGSALGLIDCGRETKQLQHEEDVEGLYESADDEATNANSMASDAVLAAEYPISSRGLLTLCPII